MNEIHHVIRVRDSAFTSGARVLLGLFVLGTGVVTFFVPEFKVAFIGQLSAANIPLQGLTQFVIPTLEGVVGAMLLGGFMIRLASFACILLMALMTYLHLAVAEPLFYPLQFGLPLMPIVALVLSAFLYFVDSFGEDD
jgi:uncharacterized membrane protein YphA (DoxX/SURF4 family)